MELKYLENANSTLTAILVCLGGDILSFVSSFFWGRPKKQETSYWIHSSSEASKNVLPGKVLVFMFNIA